MCFTLAGSSTRRESYPAAPLPRLSLRAPPHRPMPCPILPLVVKARGAAAAAASGQAAEPSGCVGGHFKTILNRDWAVFEFCAAAVCGIATRPTTAPPFFFLRRKRCATLPRHDSTPHLTCDHPFFHCGSRIPMGERGVKSLAARV